MVRKQFKPTRTKESHVSLNEHIAIRPTKNVIESKVSNKLKRRF